MKKLAVLALMLSLALNQSQAKTTSVERVLASQKRSVMMNQTRTRNVLALAVPKAHRRLLINSHLTDDDDGPAGPDELDLQVLYRRPQLSTPKPASDPDDTSDYITLRLAIARAKAIKVYNTHWA